MRVPSLIKNKTKNVFEFHYRMAPLSLGSSVYSRNRLIMESSDENDLVTESSHKSEKPRDRGAKGSQRVLMRCSLPLSLLSIHLYTHVFSLEFLCFSQVDFGCLLLRRASSMALDQHVMKVQALEDEKQRRELELQLEARARATAGRYTYYS